MEDLKNKYLYMDIQINLSFLHIISFARVFVEMMVHMVQKEIWSVNGSLTLL